MVSSQSDIFEIYRYYWSSQNCNISLYLYFPKYISPRITFKVRVKDNWLEHKIISNFVMTTAE